MEIDHASNSICCSKSITLCGVLCLFVSFVPFILEIIGAIDLVHGLGHPEFNIMTLMVSKVTDYFSQKLMNPYVILKEFQPLTSWQWLNLNTRHRETNNIRHCSDDKPKIVLINKFNHVLNSVLEKQPKYANIKINHFWLNLNVPFLIETTFIFHKI